MILIPQSVVHDCLAVFRRALPKPFLARAATLVRVISGRDGIRLHLLQPDISVEYHHPSPSEPLNVTVPISALVDCDGHGNGTVQLQSLKNGKIELRWEQSGVPYQRDYAPHEASRASIPAWPVHDVANDPSLLAALDEAMQIPTGNSGRLSLTHVQLRGKHGDIVATDGRQLLMQGGFQFPWKDALLIPRTSIFAARELPRGEVIRVAQTKTHVLIRIVGWTIALPIETSTRFPNVDAVIPKADHVVSRWHLGADEASALVKMLDNLPAAKEDQAPVTLDLARSIVLRARAEEEKRCTDVVLPRSRLEGKAVRLVADRRFLQRALELGFRSVLITAPDKPISCQEGKRLYVWVPLDPKSALAPQANAIRVILPAIADKSRRALATTDTVRRPVPVAPIPTPIPSTSRSRAFDGFLSVARSLWSLVRKHRQKERTK